MSFVEDASSTNYYPGLACQSLNVSEQLLLQGNLFRLVSYDLLSNGLVLELYRFQARKKLAKIVVCDWVLSLIPENLWDVRMSSKAYKDLLRKAIGTLHDLRKKKNSGKRYDEIKALEKEPFALPSLNSLASSSASFLDTVHTDDTRNVSVFCEKKDASTGMPQVCIQDVSCQTEMASRQTLNSGGESELNRKNNSLKHELNIKQTQLINLEKSINERQSDYSTLLKNIAIKKRFYSKKYVDQREKYARNAKKKLKINLKATRQELQNVRERLRQYEGDVKMKQKISDLNESICSARKAKRKTCKLQSKYRAQLKEKKLAESVKMAGMCASLVSDRETIRALESELIEVKAEFEEVKLNNGNVILTQSGGRKTGAFSDDVVLCTMVLLSLEVAAAKVSKVIRAVAKHIFKRDLSGLPSLQTAINIADSGHYLCKRYIAKELLIGHWGLNKDGTTRRKQKIVDTAVTLPNGVVMSVGFKRVAHEDSTTTAQLCVEELQELAEVHGHSGETNEDEYLNRTLMRLSFLMNDRAASEKAANRKFLEWRDDKLQTPDAPKVHNFFCSAHVLLGFHRAAVKSLKEKQTTLEDGGTKLGRSAMPAFKSYRKDVAVERVACAAASCFGPVGHYLGLRDRWEAECGAKDIKSQVTSYKDNRFNGLFQTSLQIFFHKDGFVDLINQVEVLQKLKNQSLNMKIRSMHADLQCPILMTLTQALGIMYVHVTGPFWDLVHSNQKYLELYKFFQPLYHSLQALSDDPQPLLTEELIILPNFPPKIDDLAKSVLHGTLPGQEELLMAVLPLLCKGFIATMNNQLKDFLPEGQYSTKANEEELQRTAMSHLTNIGCEHHLGSLDSSQRRRPNATYHHHSSVELLKKTLPHVLKWLDNMTPVQKSTTIVSSRKHGRNLRKKHCAYSKQQETIVKDELLKAEQDSKAKAAKKLLQKAKKAQQIAKKAQQQQTKDKSSGSKRKRRRLEVAAPPIALASFETESVGKYVAVMYSEPTVTWFAGIVTKVTEPQKAKVRFLVQQGRKNCFSWPDKDDISDVDAVHVFAMNFSVEPLDKMARRWKIAEFVEVEEKFKAYSRRY